MKKQSSRSCTFFLFILILFSSAAAWAGGENESPSGELTETAILEHVVDEISQDERIDEQNIEVDIDGRTLILEGRVPNRYQREAAEEEAWSVAGVEDVVNLIEVEREEEYPDDKTIENTIQVLLNLDTEIEGDYITVDSNNGEVTLTGEVEALRLKRKAGEISRDVNGVVRVVNKIAVKKKKKVSDELIAQELIQAFERNQFVNADNINVFVRNGNVTLSGTVENRQAYEMVLKLASINAGVVNVDNRLRFRSASARPEEDVIHTEIHDQFLWDSRVDEEDITILVDDGKVTLEGVVDSFTAKRAAEEDAWSIAGVEDVDNNIKVTRERDLFDEELVRTKVEQRLRSISDLDTDEISIEIERGGEVRLEGTVDAYWKKTRLRAKAGEITGVSSVKMEIAVVPTEDIEDEIIAEKIIRSLKRKVAVDPADVEVEVRNGEVDLSGTVPNRMAKKAAVAAAENTAGVRTVEDNISITQEEAEK